MSRRVVEGRTVGRPVEPVVGVGVEQVQQQVGAGQVDQQWVQEQESCTCNE